MSTRKQYFKNRVVPREKKEEVKQPLRRRAAKAKEKPKKFYRRKLKTTEDGGQPYKQCIPLNKLAQFGLGLAMYFYILLILCATCVFTGFISIPRVAEFTRNNYNNNITDVRVFGAAVCPDLRRVELYGGVQADFRPRCDFPDDASTWSDFCICIAFAVAILVAVILQHYIEVQLDERVASAQDYSIVIENPPEDADSPDEWKDFFSQYGLVRYITVNRQNRDLLGLLLKKRILLRKFPKRFYTDAETTELDQIAAECANNSVRWHVRFLFNTVGIVLTDREGECYRMLDDTNNSINTRCVEPHVVKNVFVTFEYEDEKQKCLRALENEYSIVSSICGLKNENNRFRLEYVLRARESAEPDNMEWMNYSQNEISRILRKCFSYTITAAFLFAVSIAINYAYGSGAVVLLVVVSALDGSLPLIIEAITRIERSRTEDERQESVQFKLFPARLLSVVVFPFLNTQWVEMVDIGTVASLKNIQLAACFLTPIWRWCDFIGVFKRQLLTRIFAKSEADALRFWSGTKFNLAIRYTDVAKIIFVCLFYSFLDPIALFLAAAACLFTFFLDRYTLLRNCAPPPMLENAMGHTLFKHLSAALFAKIIMSCYLSYGWRFDEVDFDTFGNYYKVSKVPPTAIWHMRQEVWQTDLQWESVESYRTYAYMAVAYMVLIFVLPYFRGIFIAIVGERCQPSAAMNQEPYSSVGDILCYCPVVNFGPESFLAADISQGLHRHCPDTLDLNDQDDHEFNLESYLPSHYDETCLAKVKWYSYPHDDNEIGSLSAPSKRSLEQPGTPVLSLPNTPVRNPDPVSKAENYLSERQSPARFGRIVGGNLTLLGEKDSDIAKKIREELDKTKSSRFNSSAAIDPSGSGLVDFNGFIALLRDRCPKTCQEKPATVSQVSPVRTTHLENKLKGVFMNELLRQNREMNGASSELVDFDIFLDHMRARQVSAALL